MKPQDDETDVQSSNHVLRAVADDRRRQILAVLRSQPSSEGIAELVSRLAVTERYESSLDVSDEKRERVHTDLVHVQLPTLEAAGLVAWDEQAATVTTDHPALQDQAFQRILELEVEGLDDVLLALSDERRRFVLDTLPDEQSPVSRATLARELCRHETGESEPDSATVNEVAASLHHVHLPKLDDVGVVEYDPETGRVADTDHPTLDEVSAIVGESSEQLVDKFDGFFGGLGTASRQASREAGELFDWPRDWTDPHHG